MARVLLVDDEVVALRALRALLEMDGYEVAAFEHAREAIEALSGPRFDVVVTDLEMPELRGEDVIRAVKVRAPGTPVVVVTAYAGSPASDRALLLGAERVFDKPLDYDALTGELSRLGAG